MPRLRAMPAPTQTRVRLGLEALVRHAAYERLRALRGAEPRARDVPRRRSIREAVGQRDGLSGYFGLDSVSCWPCAICQRP